jgi:biofilm protein TabA
MIHCAISDFRRYQLLNSRFPAVAEFLESGKLQKLGLGRHDIMGDELYVMVSPDTATRTNSLLEVHDQYADVHVLMSGVECMGWAPRAQLQKQDAPFDVARDFAYYQDEYAADFCVNAGELVVFFPEDGHAPLLGAGAIVHKAVFKVRVD